MLLLIVKVIVLYSILLSLVWYFAKQLSSKHGGDVRIITYVFMLSATIAYVLALGATDTGAVDAHGNFIGTAGKYLLALLHAMLDITTDLTVLSAIAAIALIPQFLTYLFAGSVGCARAPIFVDPVIKGLFWFAVKSFATAGGIIVSLTIFGALHGWNDVSTSKGFTIAYFGVAMLLMSFAYVLIYRSILNSIKLPKQLFCLRKVDRWFNRASRNRA